MKWKIGIFLAVLAAMASMVNAVIVNVEVGDRPYYVYGPGYYVGRLPDNLSAQNMPQP